MKIVKMGFVMNVALLASACGSTPTADYLAHQEELRAQKQEQMVKTVEDAPKWFLSPPHSDDTGVYATAMGSADSLMAARNVATLNAEFQIAKTVNQEISGRERQNTEVKNGRTLTSNDQTIVKFVQQAQVIGYNVVDQKVTILDGQYVYYVLLHLPYAKMEKMLEMLHSDFDERTQKAYKEVVERIRDNASQPAAQAQPQSKPDDVTSQPQLATNQQKMLGAMLK